MASIVSVHSYRGGTGKSNLTANLAAVLAGGGLRIGVVDTDIQSPGIHVLFELDQGQMPLALNDYLWGKCGIREAAYDVTPEPVRAGGGTIFLIPSSLKAGEIARVLRDGYDVALLNQGFKELISELELDILLIDTHPGLNEETLLSMAISDTLILILRPDRQDFQGTAVTVQVARKLGMPRMLLVVNKALARMDPEALRARVEQSYDCPVASVIALSEDLVQLGSAGILCLRLPNHPYAVEVRRIAELLAKSSG